MRITVTTYATFKAIVDELGPPASVFYSPGSPGTTREYFAVMTDGLIVFKSGGAGTSVSTTTFTTDYASAVSVPSGWNILE